MFKVLFRNPIIFAAAFALAGIGTGCGEKEGRGIYCCIYESRQCLHELDQECAAESWTDWEAGQEDFNIDDYQGSSVDLVCTYLTRDRTECEGADCVDLEYRSMSHINGYCP